jgi:hypothetical protein
MNSMKVTPQKTTTTGTVLKFYNVMAGIQINYMDQSCGLLTKQEVH